MTGRVAAVGRKTFAALRFHNYRLYFFSQIVSFSGTWMQMLAQSWLVLQLTGSGTALGLVMAAQFLPTLLLAPVGGMIADRVERRKLIMTTQLVAGSFALTLGLITVTGVVELWMVYVLAACFGTVTAVDNPSRQTFVIEMVGPGDLANAITLNSVVVNAARVIGPALGGVIIATIGIGQCFLLNAASYLAVVVALSLVRRSELHPTQQTKRAGRQLRDGFRYAAGDRNIRTTLLMLGLIGTLTYEFPTTLPLLAEQTFGAGASGLATMTALMGLGAVFGGLVTATRGNPSSSRLAGAAGAFGVATGLVAIMPTITLTYLLMPLLGAASVTVIAWSNATLQLHAPAEMRGRVMAMFSMAMVGSTPIGGPIVGFLGEHISPRFSLLVGAAAALGAAAFGRLHLTDNAAHTESTVHPADADVQSPVAAGMSSSGGPWLGAVGPMRRWVRK